MSCSSSLWQIVVPSVDAQRAAEGVNDGWGDSAPGGGVHHLLTVLTSQLVDLTEVGRDPQRLNRTEKMSHSENHMNRLQGTMEQQNNTKTTLNNLNLTAVYSVYFYTENSPRLAFLVPGVWSEFCTMASFYQQNVA